MRYLSLFLVAFLILSVPVSAFGYGLGDAESQELQINGKSMQMKTSISPEIIEDPEQSFTFSVSLIESSSENLVSDVSYDLKILDEKDNVLLDLDVGTDDDQFIMEIFPENTGDFSFSQEVIDGVLKSSKDDPLQITGPVFFEGGVYQIQTVVLSAEGQIVSDVEPFETTLIIGEVLSFEIDDGTTTHDVEFITYFESIKSLDYVPENNRVLAEMDFDWSEEFIEPIPFVHAEVYFPITWDAFLTHEINTFVNGFQVFGLVDKSQEGKIIIHFLINGKQLDSFLPKMTGENQDRILFEVSTGEKIEPIMDSHDSMEMGNDDARIEFTDKNDWKILFWWEPMQKIMPNDETTFNIMFHDPETDVMQKDIEYDFKIYQDNSVIETRTESQTLSGHALQDYTFKNNGSVTITIDNINGVDTGVDFEFTVGNVSEITIPDWVKNNAAWWADKQIDDQTFSSGIEFMIKEGIIQVPETEKQETQDAVIPDWVRNNAKWWSEDQISDNDFASGIQYLVKAGIILV